MSITLEKIDIIIERANVSYEEAKKALEENEGDLVETLIQLEKGEKIFKDKKKSKETSSKKCNNDFFESGKKFLRKIHSYKFKITKDTETIVSLPMTITILLLLFTFPFSLIALGIAVISGYKLSVKKKNGTEIVMNDIIKNEE